MTTAERIQKQPDAKKLYCWIFVDLKKAFDTVDHNMLLEKLDDYGIRGVAKDWFRSYLDNQKQYVTLNASNLSIKTTLTGVPQGSVLGPLLFLIYINDYVNVLSILKPIILLITSICFCHIVH